MNKKEQQETKAEIVRLRHGADTHPDSAIRTACQKRADLLEKSLKESEKSDVEQGNSTER